MKKIIRVAFAATFACIAGYGIYTSQQESGLSELALANIEALANGESSNNCSGGGVANVHCPIWNIKYSVDFTGPNIECSTGGSYKCEDGTCPHGK